MRAGKNPINVDMEFDLDDSIGEVPLVAEDFSRVIVNVCNNAFDAMREKMTGDGGSETGDKLTDDRRPKNGKKSPVSRRRESDGEAGQGDDSSLSYHPKLTVRTHQKDSTITLKIEDNGPGIPEEMMDKILQPFFTTKKGTEGTGLGLSITNDIIKAHGGELKIKTEEGNGSVFVISLPMV